MVAAFEKNRTPSFVPTGAERVKFVIPASEFVKPVLPMTLLLLSETSAPAATLPKALLNAAVEPALQYENAPAGVASKLAAGGSEKITLKFPDESMFVVPTVRF